MRPEEIFHFYSLCCGYVYLTDLSKIVINFVWNALYIFHNNATFAVNALWFEPNMEEFEIDNGIFLSWK